MRPNELKSKLLSGRKTLNAWSVLSSPHVIEILATLDFDSVTIDIQHGAMDTAAAFHMLQAMRGTGVTPLVRVPWNSPGDIMKALDAGAEGIICPMINSADEAQAFVSACRYPPQGIRSFGPTRAGLATAAASSADYAGEADENVLTFAMIETADGLKTLKDILAVPGLDGIYVGPGDLAMSLGARPAMRDSSPAVEEAIAACVQAARQHGVIPAIHTDGPQTALMRLSQGFAMVTLQSDARLLADGAKNQIAVCRKALSDEG